MNARARARSEIWLVLGVSLGQSAVYSLLSIIEKLTRPNQPLNQQTTQINTSVVPDRSWLDLAYQLAAIAFPLVPAFLALYLLKLTGVWLAIPAAQALTFCIAVPARRRTQRARELPA